MSLKVFNEVKQYAKDHKTTNFQALIDLMQKKENALDYLAEYKNGVYKDIIDQYKAVAPITKKDKEMAENHALYCFFEDKPTVKQKEQFLNILSNSEPSQKISLAQKSHLIIAELFENGFFDSVSNKIVFDSFNKIKPAIPEKGKYPLNLYQIPTFIFEKDPSVISNENDLLLFLNNQIDYIDNYYGCHESSYCRYLIEYSNMLNEVYKSCLFDPDNVVMKFDKLIRIKEANDLDVFSKTKSCIEIYGYCFIEDLSYEDLRKKINNDFKKLFGENSVCDYGEIFDARYYVLEKDPVIFDDELTALNLIKSYIYKRNKDLDLFMFDTYGKLVGYDLDVLVADPDFNDFIEELKQKLTIDVVEVLKEDKKLSKLYEILHLQNELANF